MLLAVAALVVAAGVTAFLLTQRGTRVLNRSAAERDVAQQFQQKQGVSVRLSCDEDMQLVDGATYHCRGVTGAGEQVTLTLRITDAKAARYTWSDR